MLRLLCLFALILTALPAAAARDIRFAGYGVPEAGTLALAVAEGEALSGAAADLDAATNGALAKAMKAAGFTGAKGKTLRLHGLGGYDQIFLVGLGGAPLEGAALAEIGGHIGTAFAENGPAEVQLLAKDPAVPEIAFGARLGSYRFVKYRQDKAEQTGALVIRTPDAEAAEAAYRGRLAAVADAVFFARDLITEPGNVIYPESFVERTREAFRGLRKVEIEVLDMDDMRRLGMGAIVGVGQGSARPPRLLVVRYSGGARDAAVLAFAGKGVTFDTGGISLKDPSGMWRMKYDMSGAAAVVGTVLSLAKRQAPVNAVAIAALVENMPDGAAQRPGDVVKTLSGKTIEIMSTDAEGRLILADAVWYAQERFEPQLMVDLATLTGSVRVALGDEYAGLFSRHDDVAEELIAAGERSGERLWRLPLHPSYAEDIASDIADIKNGSNDRLAGAGIGAQVIATFVKPETRWAHLDIAGMAWLPDRPPTPAGAAGFGVRLLDQLVHDSYEGRQGTRQ